MQPLISFETAYIISQKKIVWGNSCTSNDYLEIVNYIFQKKFQKKDIKLKVITMSSKRKQGSQHDDDEELAVEHKKKKKKYVQFIEEYDEEVSISQEIADFDIPVSFLK